MGHKKTHYEILNVTPSTSLGELKRVYKELLLSTHPDKTEQNLQNARTYMEKNDISIDQITEAYKVLTDIKLRKKYDEDLLQNGKKNGVYKFGEGVDEVSLDTFNFIEREEEYIKKCPRCQTDGSFKLTDDLLEEYAVECEGRQDGMFQVLTQCTACSLWLKVNFYAADDLEEYED
ncbi:diphthamide biosynthesis protein 4 [Monosporozyma unispora]|nr:Diphthamide biosynthesis protein 4 [Kazachstania unispora]